MSEAISQPGGGVLPRPMDVGEILSAGFRLYQRHWRTLLVAALLTGLVNTLITSPFGATSWVAQAVVVAIATTITLPYGALVGVLLYLDLRARKETLTLETLRTDLQAFAA
jgi:hypothetical protein